MHGTFLTAPCMSLGVLVGDLNFSPFLALRQKWGHCHIAPGLSPLIYLEEVQENTSLFS